MDSDQIKWVYRSAVHIYGALARHLSTLKDFAPEFSNEKGLLIRSSPAEKIITFCGYLFPKKFREGAKGDIFETRNEMRENGCSKTAIFWVTFIKITSLILSSLRVRWGDWFDPEKERNK